MRVHHTKCTITHTHVGKYISCIMHNAITQSEKKKITQTLPTFLGYGPTRYRKSKTKIAILKKRGLSKEQENKRRYTNRDPNKCSREEA